MENIQGTDYGDQEMNISIEEQIEYMRGEVEWHYRFGWGDQIKSTRHTISTLRAILATLEAMKNERAGKVETGLCRHGVPLNWKCNACSDMDGVVVGGIDSYGSLE